MSKQTVEQRYPDPKARRRADEAIDKLGMDETMETYCRVWIETYVEAGGRVDVR